MIRTPTRITAAPEDAIANHRIGAVDASVPARRAWVVTATNTTNDKRWIECHTRRGSRRIASDVTSTATSRYIATMPQASAPGCHDDA